MIREKSENSFKLKFTIKSRQCSEKQTNSNIVTGEKVKQKKRSSLHLPMSHCIPVSGGNSAKTQSDICFASQSSPRRAGSVRGQRGCVLDGNVRLMNEQAQLLSNRESRSSLLLLGRSGGPKQDSNSSGFVSSGRSWKTNREFRS